MVELHRTLSGIGAAPAGDLLADERLHLRRLAGVADQADQRESPDSSKGTVILIQAVLFVIVMIALLGWPASIYLFQRARRSPLTGPQQMLMAACFTSAAAISVTIWLASMRSGARALQAMGD